MRAAKRRFTTRPNRYFSELYRRAPPKMRILTLEKWMGAKAPLKAPEEYALPRGERVPLGEAEKVAEDFVDATRSFYSRVDVAGSIRRRKPTVKDLDILAVPSEDFNLSEYTARLRELGAMVYGASDKQVSFVYRGLKGTVYFAQPEYYGASLIYRTGPAESNIGLAVAAQRQGLKLSPYGLFDRRTGRRIAGKTEEEVFQVLGRKYTPPEQRGEGEKAARKSG